MGVEFLRGSALVGASFWCGWWVLWVCDGGHGVVVCVWGWGWVLFSFVAGTWFGSDRQGFLACVCWVWVVVVALGGWFFLVGFWSRAWWFGFVVGGFLV